MKKMILWGWILTEILCCWGCRDKATETYPGYCEGDFIYVASEFGGRLIDLPVLKGRTVNIGAILYRLDDEPERYAVEEAAKGLEQAEEKLSDLLKGKRPSEIKAIEAELDQARAALKLSESVYKRRKKLFEEHATSEEHLENARTDYQRNMAAVERIQAELETARLGARADQVQMAKAEVEAAKVRLQQAEWKRGQKTKRAEHDALVFDTLYDPGEFVPAGRPVLVLLPPENIKIRYFVPETIRGKIEIGDAVDISIDGYTNPIPASVSYISAQAEYTPPIIYSSESRAKLVYMIEARPEQSNTRKLHPGQPVDVTPGR